MASTDLILIVIAALLLGILYALNKIGQHVDTIRRIAWSKTFGEPPQE